VAAPDLLTLFTDLVAIPSPPGEERLVADYVLAYLDDLGLSATEDDAGPRIGSNSGNLLCRVPGRGNGGVPIFLCAHLDTVPPDGSIEPIVEDGVVRNGAGTILGADNKSAVAVMLHAVRRIVEERIPHAGVELLFTPMEEVGLLGAYAFDASLLEARLGYVYDQAAPIGEIILGAPSQRSISARFHGRASHAGMYPEDGRSAIVAAARAIADLRQGRIDDESTANVGLIEGGIARNIVPEWCVVEAEVRSRDATKLTELVQEAIDTMTYAATVSDCTLELDVREAYQGYVFAPSEGAVRLAVEGLERSGFAAHMAFSGGAADANVFTNRGIPCVNVANGMAEIHTPDEHIATEDLDRMVDVTLAIVDAARTWSDDT
jgi:tripeptide aminopeptidase